jgi:pyruvate/2-oxoglutarate dehydrogenase complex dihydrolipoamide dehydrogenase (E3) component
MTENTVTRTNWDAIVVGGGPTGENAAQYAAQFSGLGAAIVEAELVGGECSYWACMPSKGLLLPVELLDQARHVRGAAEAAGSARVDVAAVLARRDRIVSNLDDTSQVSWATGAGIDVIRGRGRLAGPKTVVVTAADGTETTLTANQAVVLANGTTAAVPPLPGMREARPWISRDVTNIHEVPRRVVVVGGGVVACEAATWLHGLGVEELTIVQPGELPVSRNEPLVSSILVKSFTDAGVTVKLGWRVESVSRPSVNSAGPGFVHGGEVSVTLDDGSKTDHPARPPGNPVATPVTPRPSS